MKSFFKILFFIFAMTIITMGEAKSSAVITISHTRNINMGGRMYAPVLGRFLNPDIAVQFPENSQSYNRYSYALNNPLKFTDPSGWFTERLIDEWEVDKKGNIKWVEENKQNDIFYSVDENGDRIQNVVFNYGTVEKLTSQLRKVQGESMAIDMLRVKGDADATLLFEFLAENTNVEWTHAKVGIEKSGINVIGTSHKELFTPVGHYLRETGYTLKEVTHNHPSDNPLPSGIRTLEETGKRIQDLSGAESYMNKHPNIKLNIYTRKYGYSPYNSEGTLDNRIFKQDGKYIIKP